MNGKLAIGCNDLPGGADRTRNRNPAAESETDHWNCAMAFQVVDRKLTSAI